MKFTRSRIVAGLTAVAAVAAIAWAFAPRPIEVEVANVTQGHFESAIEEDGKTRLRDRFVVAAPLTGVLSRVTLREGDAVEAGAVVATLQPVLPPLQDQRTLRELRARLAAARALADRAQAQKGAAEIDLARARNELKRSEELARGGFISEFKLDNDQLVVQTAQKNLESASNARRVADYEVDQALAALAAVEHGTPGASFALRAPVSGRVVRVAQTSETPLAAGSPVLEIGDTRRLEIVAELLTTEALQAQAGAPVVIDRWGGPRVLNGHVRAVEPGAFTKVSALGVEEQRVRVLIDIDQPARAVAGARRRLPRHRARHHAGARQRDAGAGQRAVPATGQRQGRERRGAQRDGHVHARAGARAPAPGRGGGPQQQRRVGAQRRARRRDGDRLCAVERARRRARQGARGLTTRSKLPAPVGRKRPHAPPQFKAPSAPRARRGRRTSAW